MSNLEIFDGGELTSVKVSALDNQKTISLVIEQDQTLEFPPVRYQLTHDLAVELYRQIGRQLAALGIEP
ncbi:MAG: hypothetical protein COA78_33365 [Blastopirellula sp.]|nr:MAG: hypothetical protein COA78_33365 [Blastopirellula sp.]